MFEDVPEEPMEALEDVLEEPVPEPPEVEMEISTELDDVPSIVPLEEEADDLPAPEDVVLEQPEIIHAAVPVAPRRRRDTETGPFDIDEALDFDDLLGALDAGSADVEMEPTPPSGEHVAPQVEPLELPTDVEADFDHPSMDLFDQVVSPLDEEPEEEVAEEEVVEEVEEEPDWNIPVDLSEDDIEEPELTPPALPEHLLALDPGALHVEGDGEPLATDAEQWTALSESLLAEVESTEESHRAASLELMAAHVQETLGDQDEAMARYREVLQHAPGHLAALRGLLRLHTTRQEPDGVAATLEEMADHVTAAERDGNIKARADLKWTLSGDDVETRALLDELGEDGKRDLRSLLIRADLAAVANDQEMLRAHLTAMTELLAEAQEQDAPQVAALQLELGRSLESVGKDTPARETYTAVQKIAPELTGGNEGLLRTCAALGDHQGVAQALLDSSAGVSTWATRRKRRGAVLAGNRGLEGIDALAHLKEAANLSVGKDPVILADLAEMLRAAGDAAGAVDTYRSLADASTEERQRALALCEAAYINEVDLEEPERALALFSEAHQLDPELILAADGVSRLMLADTDPVLRVEAHRKAAEVSGEGASLRHRLASARILYDELEQPAEAITEVERCLEQEPASRLALVQLAKLYRHTGDLEQLAERFDEAATRTECPDEILELRELSAKLFEGHIGKPDQSLERLREAIEFQPDHPAYRHGMLHNMIRLGRVEDMAVELELQAEAADDDARAAALWTRRAGALHSMGDHAEAEASYGRALERSQDYLPAMVHLGIRHAEQGQWEEAADRLKALMETLPEDHPRRMGLLMRMAAIHEHRLGDAVGAADLYQEVTDRGVVPGASEGLARVLASTDETARLASELQREADRVDNPGQKFALLVAAGELLDSANHEWKDTEKILATALEVLPDHPLGRQPLEELYQTHGAWQELSDMLLRDIGDQDDATRVKTYERLVNLDLLQDDKDAARRALESIVELKPDNIKALRKLQRMVLTQSLWAGLPRVLEREALASADPGEAAALWCELGRLLASHVPADSGPGAQPLSARDAYVKALECVPTLQMALRFLVDNAWIEGDTDGLGRFYVDLAKAVSIERDQAIYLTRAGETREGYELFKHALVRQPDHISAIHRVLNGAILTDDWETAADAAEAQGTSCHARRHVAAAFLLTGEIVRQHLDDSARAIEAYKKSLEVNPANKTAFTELRALLQQTEQWGELAGLLANRTRYERDVPELIELHRALADVARLRIANRDQAKLHLRLLLKLQPGDKEAWSVIGDMFFEDEQWQEAAHALLSMVRLEKEPQRLRELFHRLGVIYGEKTPDTKRAIASYAKILSIDPNDILALSRLSDLFLEAKVFDQALRVTTRLFDKETDAQRKLGHLLRIGRIQEVGLRDVHKASVAFRQAHEMAPMDLQAMEELCGFFIRQRDQRSLMVYLDQSITAMRQKLTQDPFDPFPYRALFKIFGWRKAVDECLCAAETLEALGHADAEITEFLRKNKDRRSSAGSALADSAHDEALFQPTIPGGFRQVFQLLSESFAKIFRGDLKARGLKRSDRLSNQTVLRIAAAQAKEMGVTSYDVYNSSAAPTAMMVENTDPPAIIVGQQLLDGASEGEVKFLFSRCMWIIRKAMILPALRTPEELELLVAGIVRQYATDFQPAAADAGRLGDVTRQVAKAIPRKIKMELMPFALECSGVELRSLGAAILHSANRAGLLASGSVLGAISCLGKVRGQFPQRGGDLAAALRGNPEVEELLRYSVSNDYFAVRRSMNLDFM